MNELRCAFCQNSIAAGYICEQCSQDYSSDLPALNEWGKYWETPASTRNSVTMSSAARQLEAWKADAIRLEHERRNQERRAWDHIDWQIENQAETLQDHNRGSMHDVIDNQVGDEDVELTPPESGQLPHWLEMIGDPLLSAAMEYSGRTQKDARVWYALFAHAHALYREEYAEEHWSWKQQWIAANEILEKNGLPRIRDDKVYKDLVYDAKKRAKLSRQR